MSEAEARSLLESLNRTDVLRETGDKLQLSPGTWERYDGFVDELEDSGSDPLGIENELPALSRIIETADLAEEGRTHYSALGLLVTELGLNEAIDLLKAVVFLDQFFHTPRTEDGTPTEAVPISMIQFRFLTHAHPKSVVYIWRDDCEPCDQMKTALDAVFADTDPETEIPLFSLFGPTNAQDLHEEYDVDGAPTTLFMKDGDVDSRLQGAQFESVIRSELNTLRTL